MDRFQRKEKFKTLPATGFDNIMQIQQLFIDFDDTNLDETVEIILKNPLMQSASGMEAFVDDLFCSVCIRSYDMKLFVQLVEKLFAKLKDSNKSEFSELLVKKALLPFPEWRLHERVPVYRLLRLLFQSKLVKIEPIAHGIENYPEQYPLQFTIFYYFFAPEISRFNFDVEKHIHAKIKALYKRINAEEKKTVELEQFLSAASKLDSYVKDNYMNLLDYINLGSPQGSIEFAIKNDDALLLEQIVEQQHIDLNERIPENLFEPCLFVNWSPTPAEYACFFRSYNCFKYIMHKNVNLEYITLFATAGGNEKILKYLAAKKLSFEGCPRIAAYFRRMDLFEWIMTRHANDFNKKKELNLCLCRACAINYLDLIVQCIDIGANINYKDENLQTPLMVAASNNSYESVVYLLTYPSLKLLPKNGFGHSAVQLSTDPRIVAAIQQGLDDLPKPN